MRLLELKDLLTIITMETGGTYGVHIHVHVHVHYLCILQPHIKIFIIIIIIRILGRSKGSNAVMKMLSSSTSLIRWKLVREEDGEIKSKERERERKGGNY